MDPQRRDDQPDPRWDDGAAPRPQWDGSPDPRPMHERGVGPDDDSRDDNLFTKYRAVWAVLITLITLLVCWQILQFALDVGF
ncbi:MAG TPA: hypothetical protein GX015_03275 [Corynebacterium sp.]|uniref:Uncharacterized protein n=1 Tax=Corynebacterium xerosis TaxID=1725 RepID=A0A6B8TJW0_9CORY|nr:MULTISPECIES: hypothetical protein [Corynebacterium]QGS33812.1 hypothetical protein FOB82_01465 [Corynebacterium xerosis]HHT31556.1 hypothetical protein [Corynebacterium sp.]